MTCKLCRETPKGWNGSDRTCAFEGGEFSHDNWMCETVNRIRDLVYEGQPHKLSDYRYCEDQKYSTVCIDRMEGPYLALWVSWYKSRGRTDAIYLLSDNEPPKAPTEFELVEIIAYLEANK